MKKRIISTIAAAMLITAAPVMAAEPDSGELGEEITWTIDENGLLTIEGSGAAEAPKGMDSPFRNNKDITGIVMDEHITAIGDRMFEGCTSLVSVDLSENVENIGDYAFAGCTALGGIELNESLGGLGKNAFSGCTAMKSIDVDAENGTFTSEDGVLYDDDKSELIKFPPAKVMESFAVPYTVVQIDDNAFEGCAGIGAMEIPGSVSSIGTQTWYELSSLAAVNVGEDNTIFSSRDGVLYDKEKRTLISVPPANKAEELYIPGTVKELAPGAVCMTKNIKSIYVPASVKSAGVDAFSDNGALTDIYYEGSDSEWAALYPDDGFYSLNSGVNDVNIHTNAKVIEEPENKTEYTDIPADAWYYEYVKFATDTGIIDGITGDEFRPDEDITRAAFITAVYRLENMPEVTAENMFEDVEDDAFYRDAVVWGNENGIINGVSDTEFEPDERITREQLATMIYRYIKFNGEEGLTGDRRLSLDYIDADKISGYAYEPVLWCSMNEVIGGFDDGTVRPQGNTTRAQAAAILMRLNER